MTIPQYLSTAAHQVLRQKRLVAVYYACTLAMAALAVAPLTALLAHLLGHSEEGARLFANLDPTWILETLRSSDYLLVPSIPVLLGAVVLVYVLLSTFLAGGSLAVFLNEQDGFFSACARYFPRFLRLLTWSVPLYLLVLALNGAAGKLISRLSEDSMQQHTWVIAGWVRSVIVLLLLLKVNMIVDFAKVVLVVDARYGAFRALRDSIRLMISNPVMTTGIFYTTQLFGLLFLLLYHGLSELAGQNSAGTVAAVFVLRQAYMLSRFWVRFWTWSADLGFYVSTIPAPLPEPLEPAAEFQSPLPEERNEVQPEHSWQQPGSVE